MSRHVVPDTAQGIRAVSDGRFLRYVNEAPAAGYQRKTTLDRSLRPRG